MAETLIPISEQERAKREQALVATIANLRIEDLHLDEELKCIFQRHVDGEIGDEELGAAIDELNERRFGPLRISRNAHPWERPPVFAMQSNSNPRKFWRSPAFY